MTDATLTLDGFEQIDGTVGNRQRLCSVLQSFHILTR